VRSDSIGHVPKNPDRIAQRPLGWDVQYQEWPNRASMARSIRMQQSGENWARGWVACVPLSDGEGY
jgi:hypothetical protein